MRLRTVVVVSALLMGLLFTGCGMSIANYTARTLDPGEGDVALTFNGGSMTYKTSYSDTVKHDTDVIVNFLGLIPDIDGHVGIAKDLEIGGRVSISSFGLSGDCKYRFYHEGGNHLAIAPFASFFHFTDFNAGSQLLATHDLSPNVAVNLCGFGDYQYMKNTLFTGVLDTVHDFIDCGVTAGPEFRTETFYIRPSFTYNINIPLVKNATIAPVNFYRINVSIGWILGKEKQQLNRIEKKLDSKLNRLDTLEGIIDNR